MLNDTTLRRLYESTLAHAARDQRCPSDDELRAHAARVEKAVILAVRRWSVKHARMDPSARATFAEYVRARLDRLSPVSGERYLHR